MNRLCRAWCICLSCCFLLLIQTSAYASEPYVPTDDNEVLETLPRDLLTGGSDMDVLRRKLVAAPDDADLAAALAQSYIRIGKAGSDPRYFGYARAALQPWWDHGNPHPDILRLRAKLKETEHAFDAAISDLRLLVDQHPDDVQAWIELANIYCVKGMYPQAQEACDNLYRVAGKTQTLFSQAPLYAVTGKAEEAYDAVTELLPLARERWPGTVQWLLTMQAEIARLRGQDTLAERHFREGLSNNPSDSYLIRTYGDFLIDRGRDKEALSLLRDNLVDTGSLLGAAIAARRCGEDSLADRWQEQLASRFEEIRLRGDRPHGRYEARYLLVLKDDPQQALNVALANWRQQKEARDSRTVLEAAIAADDPDAARPVLEFLADNGTQDVELLELAERLGRKE